MAEEVTNVDEGQNRLDVAAEQEAKLMAARKALAKVQLRTRLDNRVHKVDEGLYIGMALPLFLLENGYLALGLLVNCTSSFLQLELIHEMDIWPTGAFSCS